MEKYVAPHLALKAFVAFNSSGTPDNILSVFLNYNNIPTFSLQHGAIVNYKQEIPADIINIENMTAEKMLLWGKDSYKFMQNYGYKDNQLIIAGNPKYKHIEIKETKNTFNSGLVILGRWLYESENFMLLDILNQFILSNPHVKLKVKPHPSLKISKYQKYLSNSKIELLEKNELLPALLKSNKFDFAITYNTTAYYESMTIGIPSLRFAYHENEELNGLDDRFSTKIELEKKIELFKTKDKLELKDEFEKTLISFFGYNNINYSDIFEKL